MGVLRQRQEDGLPTVFDGAYPFSEGLAAVEVDGKWGYVDTRRNMVILAVYDYAGPFSEGLAAVAVDGKYGFIDAKQTITLQSLGDWSGSSSEGLVPVKVDDKWGWVDRNKGMAIPPAYLFAEPFNGGLARVQSRIALTQWDYIDTQGTQYWED